MHSRISRQILLYLYSSLQFFERTRIISCQMSNTFFASATKKSSVAKQATTSHRW